MTKRQALRNYQSYLADRLKQVEATASTAAWLGVGVDGRRFLLPLADTAEIASGLPSLGVPHTQSWLTGIANWRGAVLTVVDWGRWYSWSQHADSAQTPTAPAPTRRWMVSLNPVLDTPCLLAVDETFGLKSVPEWQGPAFTPDDENCYVKQYDDRGEAWTVVNLKAICRRVDFLNISLVAGST